MIRVQREKNERIKGATGEVSRQVRKQAITRAEYEAGK